jgi:hypothetical protein
MENGILYQAMGYGPRRVGSIPGKWMGEDGKTFYYIFSGDDSFSVRKLVLEFDK